MRRKIRIKIWDRIFKIWELTVWWYFLALTDVEQFLEEIFSEFNSDIPKMDDSQFKVLIKLLFKVKDKELETVLNTKKTKTDPLKDFHIKIWFFMKFFWNSYEQTMNTPLKVFNDLLDDIKIFAWEEKYDKDRKNSKKKLKSLVNNIKNNV